VTARRRTVAALPVTRLQEELRADGELPPVVTAAGPSSFLREQVVRHAATVSLGDPESPDLVLHHGPTRAGEADTPALATILDDVRTPSLFAAAHRKVVLVRRSDRLLAADADAVAAFLERPPAGALLILEVTAGFGDRGTGKGLQKVLDSLADAGLLFACDAPTAEPGRGGRPSALAEWVAGRARERGARLSPEDAELLVIRTGNDLASLDGAVEAALLQAEGRTHLTPADLEAVAPRGAAESTDRFTEALLAREPAEALRVLEGLYREGATPWGAKSPVRGDTSITFLLLGQVRRLARDANRALVSGGNMPPALRFGCRDPRKLLSRSSTASLAGLLSRLTEFEADLKSGHGGAERARWEAMIVEYAGKS
jgi:DNA polymerase III delta subunit